jgi:hypothetical protein
MIKRLEKENATPKGKVPSRKQKEVTPFDTRKDPSYSQVSSCPPQAKRIMRRAMPL